MSQTVTFEDERELLRDLWIKTLGLRGRLKEVDEKLDRILDIVEDLSE